jgi:hypothetical protein
VNDKDGIAMKMRGIYPLYPKARKVLKGLLAIYGLVLLASLPPMVVSDRAVLAVPYAVLAAVGLVITAHLLVVGVEPPADMPPRSDPPKDNESKLEVNISGFTARPIQLYLVGEEARPMDAFLPLLLLLVLTFCGVPAAVCVGLFS